jgi:hypothetical protein
MDKPNGLENLKKTYEKLNYFDQYGGSVIILIIITCVLIVIISYCCLKKIYYVSGKNICEWIDICLVKCKCKKESIRAINVVKRAEIVLPERANKYKDVNNESTENKSEDGTKKIITL